MAVSLWQTIQIVSGLPTVIAYGNYASADTIEPLEWWRNYFTLGAGGPDVYATRCTLVGSPGIFLPKTTALHQSRAVCENHMISSHRFEEHFQQSYTLRTPVDEKRRVEKHCEQSRRRYFGGQTHGGLGVGPFVA